MVILEIYDVNGRANWEVIFDEKGFDEVSNKLNLTAYSKKNMFVNFNEVRRHSDFQDTKGVQFYGAYKNLIKGIYGLVPRTYYDLYKFPVDKAKRLFTEYGRWLDD